MRPFEINMVRKRGDTKRITFVIKSNGRAIPIGGWSQFKMGIDAREFPGDSSTNIAVINGLLTTNGDDGRVYFPVPSDIPAGAYFYDAQAIDENGEIGTFVEGKIKFEQDCAK